MTPENISLASSIASLSASERRELLQKLSRRQAEALRHDWRFWARPKQMAPPGDWRFWLNLSGRGTGKTRAGAEFIRERIDTYSHITLCGAIASEVRDVMVEGESGLMSVFPDKQRPNYEPSKRRITFHSGARAVLLSADEPDRIRGRQSDLIWCDELAAWRYPESFDQLMLGFRLGEDPRCVITTTPKPTPLIKQLVARAHPEKGDGTVALTRESTYDNLHNLAPAFAAEIIARYEGTRLGRQELLAEILDDLEGALWKRDQLEGLRVRQADLPAFVRIVVGVDPSGGVAETGIVVAGLGVDGHGYVLDDCSCEGSPNLWGVAVIDAMDKYSGDRIVAEVNQGGAMVSSTIRTVRESAPIRTVHASRGKMARAEPVAALYEQRKVHHVGAFTTLEDQMCGWEPTGNQPSPDRLDALVWALTDLMIGQRESTPQGPQVVTGGRSYG